MTSVVRCSLSSSASSASCTTRSLSVSSALVASSSSSTRGRRTMQRAMATRCFWPPLSCAPRSPTDVWYWSSNLVMKSWAFASLAAAIASSSVAPSRPYLMLSSTLPAKRTGSCCTSDITDRSHCRFSERISCPSNVTQPAAGS
mmetsp:Transcript_100248/g.272560  ORF Transcript_100248/g.272560 Transcript_100248/m.272560 type:complete len:144 (+) Transcript_100248:415-846(+)